MFVYCVIEKKTKMLPLHEIDKNQFKSSIITNKDQKEY